VLHGGVLGEVRTLPVTHAGTAPFVSD